jgi:hypothetical protein
MAQTKVETLMASYAGMTSGERLEFRAMLAGYDMRGMTRSEAASKKSGPKKAAADKAAANQ